VNDQCASDTSDGAAQQPFAPIVIGIHMPFSVMCCSHALYAADKTLEVGGVLHCIAMCIVVKVDEDVEAVGQILRDVPGMDREGLTRVSPAMAPTVKA
jgi:hypothetical protein